MKRPAQYAILLFLTIAPVAIYSICGVLWLKERGWFWVLATGAFSIVCGALFAILLERWTKSSRQILPPIDWKKPDTFSEFDSKAWSLVEQESLQGEKIPLDNLISIDTYIDTARRMAGRVAAHYHPLSADPLDQIPVIQILTAIELASEDLTGLCRQIPGGDLVTASDWKRAVVAAGYIQKFNSIYNYVLPLFNPITGVSRLASQQFMVKPAWKDMQQNVLRWFYQSFVNRLGLHLIELNSGRLVIGATTYRKITKRARVETGPSSFTLNILVVGREGGDFDRLFDEIKPALAAAAADPTLSSLPEADRRAARIVFENLAVNRQPIALKLSTSGSARNRSAIKHAAKAARSSDLILMVKESAGPPSVEEAQFLAAIQTWFADHPKRISPSVLILANAEWEDRSGTLAAIPAEVAGLVAGIEALPEPGKSLDASACFATIKQLCLTSERVAIHRHLRTTSDHSRAKLFAGQLAANVGSMWSTFRKGKP